jgi:3-deoxy-D-manno-octulosonic-acid transferase
MKKFWYIIYNVFVFPLLYGVFWIARIVNDKIKSGFDERKIQEQILPELIKSFDKNKKTIWVHSSSLGEFEQAKPIIRKLKNEYDINIFITFFSPSGYDNSKKYPYADAVAYLPFDKPSSVKLFINTVNPDIVIFMRYDFWPNLLWQLKDRGIFTLLVDATMVATSKRKLPIIKAFHKTLFNCIDLFLTVSENDVRNFLDFSIPPQKLTAVGDTRYDRVFQKSMQAREKKLFRESLFEGKKVFLFGSSWPEDEEVIFPAFEKLLKENNDVVMIIAPHEPTVVHLEKIENYFTGKEKTIRFSSKNRYNNERVIIIDSIGILLTLYFYADVAYVGGSFKQGIHNVLEPAVYGIPVLFGPKIDGSVEAGELVKRGAAFIVKNENEAFEKLNKLFSDDNYKIEAGKKSSEFVNEHTGATEKIVAEIEKII